VYTQQGMQGYDRMGMQGTAEVRKGLHGDARDRMGTQGTALSERNRGAWTAGERKGPQEYAGTAGLLHGNMDTQETARSAREQGFAPQGRQECT
jgi:hypothetical protein